MNTALAWKTAAQRRMEKDDLIRREHVARNRAQLAAVAVEEARGTDRYDTAWEAYRAAAAELEDLMHETGEYD